MKDLLSLNRALTSVGTDHPFFPGEAVALLGGEKAVPLAAIGNIRLLQEQKVGLVCSVRCRGALILKTYEFVKTIAPSGPVIVSGFHSPLEKQCLEVLLRRHVRAILCPARGLEKMRLPPDWRDALAGDRLLILSRFFNALRRSTRELAFQRNRFVAALADQVIIPFASAGGQTERFAREIQGWGKTLLTFGGEGNEGLIALGATCLAQKG
jgi:predicted Rossmann fold nucleotide-binding protein DprA/Smf involved in DNA uptake